MYFKLNGKIPTTYEELNQEGKNRYSDYKIKYPLLPEDLLAYLCFWGEDNLKKHLKISDVIPTQFFVYTVTVYCYIKNNFYHSSVLYTSLNFKDCLDCIEDYVNENKEKNKKKNNQKKHYYFNKEYELNLEEEYNRNDLVTVKTQQFCLEKNKGVNVLIEDRYVIGRSLLNIWPDSNFVRFNQKP